MGDFFDSDSVTKGYDRGLTKRILGYLRPHGRLVTLTAIALCVATGGELVLPIVIRSVVDGALMPAWRVAEPGLLALPEAAELKLAPGGARDKAVVEVAGRLAIPSSRFGSLTAAQRKDLETRGILDPGEWYLADLDAGGRKVAEARPGLLTVGGDHALLESAKLGSLSTEEARALRGRDLAYTQARALVFLLVLVAVLGASFVQTWASALVGQRVMKDLRMQLFRHCTTRSLAFLSRHPVGRLVTRMTSDVETINQFFTDVIVAFMKDASLMAGVLVVLVVMDGRLALVTLATLAPVTIVTIVSRGKARDAFKRQRQWISRVNAYIAERLAGISLVQLFIREEASTKEFEKHDQELLRASLGEMYVYATFRPAVDLLGSTSLAIMLWYGAHLLDLQLLSLGTLIAFINLIRMFYSPVMDISEKYTLLQSAMAGAERVFRLLDAEESIPDGKEAPLALPVRGHIEFDKVWFAYKDEEWILRDLSFTVGPGEMVAIVGPTGAGKTTIANLITRLWDIQRGAIRIDGREVRALPLDELRRAVQPVLQDVFLFSGTIEENIRMGEDVTEERMRRAAEAVSASGFIEALPEGYGAELSEGATNISQGQRQLLSFARVLAHEPAVIILDEATSSIDTETERLVQRGLEALLAGRTSVVIAHRLSTIRHADRILVLAEGRVAESGRHDELLALKGIYWNLYRLQYGGVPA